MPWNNNGAGGPGGSPGTGPGGGSGGNQGNSPWGNPRPGGPQGGPQGPWGPPGGNRPPSDLDDIIRQAQDQVRRWLPRGFGGGGSGSGGGKAVLLLGILVIGAWAASGFYRVQPDEQGIVMRFGAYDRQTNPGLNYRLPWPIESVTTPRVTRINRVDIGYLGPNDAPAPAPRPVSGRDVVEESMMLTGDENIIDIDFAVFWRIRDAGKFLFNTRNPEVTVKSAAESMMREVIGRTPIQPALTEARASIEQQVRQGTQSILDQYDAGVEITQVQLQKVDPPGGVVDSFRDVQRANADRERARNEADAYRNDIVPRARGEAERMLAEAAAYRESAVARARGESQRFLSVLSAYQQAQDITIRRLYIETMEEILRKNPKVILDERLQGIVPYLQLGDGARAPQRPAAPPPPPAVTGRPAPVPTPATPGAPR
jgi:membrane protease subunit HflK